MICPQCSNSLPDGAKFCMNCGAKTASATPAVPTQTAPAPVPNNLPTANVTNLPIGVPSQLPNVPTFNSMQADTQRNWLERLVNKIPGFKGYQDKEMRREVDKIQREHLTTMLFQLKTPINAVVRELSENRRLFEVGPIERALQKLDKIENRIRYASYGYTGFFDVVKIQEAQLDQLYHFDVALVDDVELVKAHVDQLVAKVSDAKALKSTALELEKALDALDTKFSQRHQAIENPGYSPF